MRHSQLDAEMTQRQLSDEELENVVEDIRKELTAGLAFLNERVD